jgi:spore germination cell wall hydrolase CwlJ-like protein
MGTPVSVKTGQAGSQIKGAIQGVKAPTLPKQDVSRGVTVPSATVTTQQLSPSAARAAMGDVAPTPSIYKTVADADRAIVAEATKTYNQRFGTNYTPAQFSQLSKTVAGEAAGESDFGRAAVANTFVNRAALAQVDESPYGYMGGEDFAILADQYDAYRMQNAPYRAAVPGSKTYQQGVNAMYQAMNPQSTFSKTASPKVLTATHYYNPAEVRREPDWAGDKTKFERVGSHLFGTAEASQKAVAKARAEQIARAGTTIVPTSSTPERAFVPGLIKYPDLARPPSVGRSAVVPTKDTAAQEAARLRGLMESYQQPPGYAKRIVDRAPTYDGGPPESFVISPKYERISSDPTLEGKRLKQTYDRLTPEDPELRQRMGEIAAQSPSYFVQGAPDERMLYNTSQKTLDRMNQVFDRSRGMSYTPSLPAQSSYFGDVPDFKPSTPSRSYFGGLNERETISPSRSYFGDIDNRTVTTPSRSYFGDIGERAVTTPSRSYFGDIGDRTVTTPSRSYFGDFGKLPTEKLSNVEDEPEIYEGGVPKEYAEKYGLDEEEFYELVGEEAADAAKKAGFPRSVYTNEDFLNDPDQLGLMREEITTPLSPEDMAKVVERSRALNYEDVKPYLTGPEKVRAKVSDVVERIVTFGAPAKVATATAKKLMSIESPEKFLSRPSYEQQALYEYAREANTRYRPGEAGLPQVGGPGNSGVIGGGSGLGGDGLGGGDKGNSGIAALVNKPKGDETTTPEPDTPSTSPGRRPDIYYMWDLGVNVPSPGDPNYNQYQTYLAERLAAQRAMG